METLHKINLNLEELEKLPLFFKRIFYNQVTNLEDELKLYKYNSESQSLEMRSYYPNRIICKMHEPKTLKNEVFKK